MSDRKFMNDAARAFVAIIILIMLAISPAIVLAAWRALL